MNPNAPRIRNTKTNFEKQNPWCHQGQSTIQKKIQSDWNVCTHVYADALYRSNKHIGSGEKLKLQINERS